MVSHIFCLRNHISWVRTIVWFSKSKAADVFTRGHFWKILILLFLTSKIPNWIHCERSLYRSKGSKPGISSFKFLTDESVCYIREARATVTLQWSAEHTHFSKSDSPFVKKNSFCACVFNLWNDFFINPVTNHVANHYFFFSK